MRELGKKLAVMGGVAVLTVAAPGMGRRHDPTLGPGGSYANGVPPGQVVVAPAPAGADQQMAAFGTWLNATRAQYGLAPVSPDPNLTNWAAANNTYQAARGMGHYVQGPARRQNAAMGGYADIGPMWMASPGHRAALLDPTITRFGLAGLGRWWTFDAT